MKKNNNILSIIIITFTVISFLVFNFFYQMKLDKIYFISLSLFDFIIYIFSIIIIISAIFQYLMNNKKFLKFIFIIQLISISIMFSTLIPEIFKITNFNISQYLLYFPIILSIVSIIIINIKYLALLKKEDFKFTIAIYIFLILLMMVIGWYSQHNPKSFLTTSNVKVVSSLTNRINIIPFSLLIFIIIMNFLKIKKSSILIPLFLLNFYIIYDLITYSNNPSLFNKILVNKNILYYFSIILIFQLNIIQSKFILKYKK